jgi:hypothetical protein
LITGGSLERLNDVASYIGVELHLEDGIHYGSISNVGFGSLNPSANYPYPGGSSTSGHGKRNPASPSPPARCRSRESPLCFLPPPCSCSAGGARAADQ